MPAPIVISLGGSVVAPPNGIDVAYLKKFRDLIRREAKKGKRFVIVVGGGSTARNYQKAASEIVRIPPEDVDWIGIHATRLNGQLLHTLFHDISAPHVVKDPTRPLGWSQPVLVAAGWKPGWSTDYVAVRLAKKVGATRVINLTNIDAVYDKDPSKFEDAAPIAKISWKDFRKIVGDTWSPGANAPFDPVASKFAHRSGLDVVIAKGADLENVKRIIEGKAFKGTRVG